MEESPKKRKRSPNLKCEHGTRKGYCKIENCDSKHLCNHKIARSSCKDQECGGGGMFCMHNMQRSVCKDPECGGGGGLCTKHKIARSKCKDPECGGGGSLCTKHKIERSNCKDPECGGGGVFCMHNIRRSMCKDPECGGGGTFCMHNIRRSRCKNLECGGGGSLCTKHKIERSRCKDPECNGGGAFCDHDIFYHDCKQCVPIEKRLKSGKFCVMCTDKRLSLQRRRAGIKMCATCDPNVPDRIEHIVKPLFVDAIGMEPTIADDATLGGKGCGDITLHRPDMLFVRANEQPACFSTTTTTTTTSSSASGSVAIRSIGAAPLELVGGRIVCLEIDENGGHPDYEPSCDAGKISNQVMALHKLCGASTRIFFIRFNPDEFDGGRVSLDERIAHVGAHCKWLLEDGWRQFEPEAPHVAFYYYHSKCAKHIDYIRANPNAFHMFRIEEAADEEAADNDVDDINSDDDDCSVDDDGGGGLSIKKQRRE